MKRRAFVMNQSRLNLFRASCAAAESSSGLKDRDAKTSACKWRRGS
jgi:hypothetical protein